MLNTPFAIRHDNRHCKRQTVRDSADTTTTNEPEQ